MPDWIWVPITILAALCQTFRNTAQRSLIESVGMLGATLVRFLYGLPFAAAWLAAVWLALDFPPAIAWAKTGPAFLAWMAAGAVLQLAATAFLLRAMTERNFVLGVAYSKTEILQVAVFGLAFLGDPLSPLGAAAITAATLGVMLVSAPKNAPSIGSYLGNWMSPAALYGLASGMSFAISAVGYRGAILELGIANPVAAAAYTLVWAQAAQTALLGGWLAVSDRAVLAGVARAWRVSAAAGFLGAAASALWFTAFALEPAARVRTLGMVELVFSLAVSARIFRERLSGREWLGLAFLAAGLVGIVLPG